MMNAVFYDTSENFHPYECDGPGECVHCDRRTTDAHDPMRCALCSPQPDPNAKYDWDRDALALDEAPVGE